MDDLISLHLPFGEKKLGLISDQLRYRGKYLLFLVPIKEDDPDWNELTYKHDGRSSIVMSFPTEEQRDMVAKALSLSWNL